MGGSETLEMLRGALSEEHTVSSLSGHDTVREGRETLEVPEGDLSDTRK
jgi:hypothetical protein